MAEPFVLNQPDGVRRPTTSVYRDPVERFFSSAGVAIGGSRTCDVHVHDVRFFERVARLGALGLGEAYVDGAWDCEALDALFHRLALTRRASTSGARRRFLGLLYKVRNLQSSARATQVAEAHYNLGNEMFAQWLDPSMQYSCAYWDGADSLAEAQRAKLDLVCRKLHLRPTDRVLEIGCGWGGLARHIASSYGCHVTALNVSREQVKYARDLCRGLPVEIVEGDYREVQGRYDRVVSVAMFEAVGAKNFRTYMEVVHRALKDDGIFLLHTIGDNLTRTNPDAWIVKYIFPNGYLPSIARLGQAMERLFVLEDWHNLGPHYDRTLMEWCRRFDERWPTIRALDARFDERFRRMWRYYLLSSAGSFRGRELNLWQLVMTKHRTGTHYQRIACR